MIDPRFEDEAIAILMEQALSETTEETKFDVDAYFNSDICLLYTSPSPRDATLSRMPSSA